VYDRGLRAGWRLAIWLAIVFGIEFALYYAVQQPLHVSPTSTTPGNHSFLDPAWSLVVQASDLISVLVASLILARVEHLSLRDYYIPTRNLFGRQLWEGSLWGLLAVSLLIGLIAIFHGYRIIGLAIHGRPLAHAVFWWLIQAFAIGFSEEFLFRSYLLRTLADGIHFWPAAILVSISFGCLHYFFKPYERWEDFASTGLFSLFCCLAIRRTHSLNFAIGFHAAFDWAAIFLYSGQNGGEFAPGHLLQTSWTGPNWLTGGMLGPETSWFVFPIIALLFLVFSRLYPSPSPNATSQST